MESATTFMSSSSVLNGFLLVPETKKEKNIYSYITYEPVHEISNNVAF